MKLRYVPKEKYKVPPKKRSMKERKRLQKRLISCLQKYEKREIRNPRKFKIASRAHSLNAQLEKYAKFDNVSKIVKQELKLEKGRLSLESLNV